MSNINVIGVIGALFIATVATSVYMALVINRRNIEIATGVVEGVSISWDLRWRNLLALQVPMYAGLGAFNLIMAFAFRAIGANLAHSADVQVLAWLCAWLGLCMGCLALTLGPVALAATWKAAKL